MTKRIKLTRNRYPIQYSHIRNRLMGLFNFTRQWNNILYSISRSSILRNFPISYIAIIRLKMPIKIYWVIWYLQLLLHFPKCSLGKLFSAWLLIQKKGISLRLLQISNKKYLINSQMLKLLYRTNSKIKIFLMLLKIFLNKNLSKWILRIFPNSITALRRLGKDFKGQVDFTNICKRHYQEQ